jgi:hypothetical protein
LVPAVIPPRIVSLVLVTADGTVLGRLPAFRAETPWWQDAGPVVRAARERFGLDVTILRLLDTELPSAHGGAVTYLAEVDGDELTIGRPRGAVELAPWAAQLADDPLRQPYARPGGPAADLAWADAVLEANGMARVAPADQVRTWNLSSLWRLPTRDEAAWLKVVPPFFEHEGSILELLRGGQVPRLLGHEGGRMLLAEIEGEDRYDAPLPELLEMVDILVRLQVEWTGRTPVLLGNGLPDWRGPSLAGAIAAVVERASARVSARDRSALARFVSELPGRIAAIEACGLPDTLVHGDFHPGNVRGITGALVLLDWGDSGVGHPLLDQPAFLTRIEAADVETVRHHWLESWRRAVRGSDPELAARLLAPFAAARQAVIYQIFLDNIEASEHGYHCADVPDWLGRTADIVRAER